ncbi:unnamed protein product [Moneuplotes crassus]|uniref:Uncharacterized protein n=1 Tax=Euplotes crassus TaxID=5936 RepID=A0AAD1U8Q1_EUPCR|nr:unnamed protein product [Moneuplotes crassus]
MNSSSQKVDSQDINRTIICKKKIPWGKKGFSNNSKEKRGPEGSIEININLLENYSILQKFCSKADTKDIGESDSDFVTNSSVNGGLSQSERQNESKDSSSNTFSSVAGTLKDCSFNLGDLEIPIKRNPKVHKNGNTTELVQKKTPISRKIRNNGTKSLSAFIKTSQQISDKRMSSNKERSYKLINTNSSKNLLSKFNKTKEDSSLGSEKKVDKAMINKIRSFDTKFKGFISNKKSIHLNCERNNSKHTDSTEILNLDCRNKSANRKKYLKSKFKSKKLGIYNKSLKTSHTRSRNTLPFEYKQSRTIASKKNIVDSFIRTPQILGHSSTQSHISCKIPLKPSPSKFLKLGASAHRLDSKFHYGGTKMSIKNIKDRAQARNSQSHTTKLHFSHTEGSAQKQSIDSLRSGIQGLSSQKKRQKVLVKAKSKRIRPSSSQKLLFNTHKKFPARPHLSSFPHQQSGNKAFSSSINKDTQNTKLINVPRSSIQ